MSRVIPVRVRVGELGASLSCFPSGKTKVDELSIPSIIGSSVPEAEIHQYIRFLQVILSQIADHRNRTDNRSLISDNSSQ